MNQAQRQSVWTASGWLGIVIGTLFALGSGAMLILITVLSIQGKDVTAHGTRVLSRPMQVLYRDARILPAFFLLAAALACVAGIGLVRRRSYGRTLTLAFGVVSVAWSTFVVVTFWFAVVSPAPQGPSLVFRLWPALMFTPMVLAYSIAIVLLCRSVYSHPEEFSGERPGIGA